MTIRAVTFILRNKIQNVMTSIMRLLTFKDLTRSGITTSAKVRQFLYFSIVNEA